jgi:DNA-binding MarR family transcriptional regulator
MVTPFAQTPAEKRELALHMHHNGHTYRTICKEVRLSPSTLSSIIKSEAGYIENSENELDYKSKETKALALYENNIEPLQVAVELDIPADKAVEFYEKFQRLKSIPLEDRQIKLTHEIKQLESEKSRTNSQLIDLRNLVIESNRMLEFYKTECERLLVLYCQRKQLVGW